MRKRFLPSSAPIQPLTRAHPAPPPTGCGGEWGWEEETAGARGGEGRGGEAAVCGGRLASRARRFWVGGKVGGAWRGARFSRDAGGRRRGNWQRLWQRIGRWVVILEIRAVGASRTGSYGCDQTNIIASG
jgi:hypothetical protein